MMHADNESEAMAILFLIGLVVIALVLSGIIYLISLIINWWRFR